MNNDKGCCRKCRRFYCVQMKVGPNSNGYDCHNKSCPCHHPTTDTRGAPEKWEEAFNEKFCNPKGGFLFGVSPRPIKSFISRVREEAVGGEREKVLSLLSSDDMTINDRIKQAYIFFIAITSLMRPRIYRVKKLCQ